ncbi:MAG: DUF5666 domain-containing protein [Caldimonas sp.]
MKRTFDLGPQAARVLCGLLTVAALAGCGGDGAVGSGGTGRGDTGVAIGTVNGFGSVIVDGVAYDDRDARVVTEVAPGVDALSEVKLGDRVAVDYMTAGVASQVRVDTTLSGPVATGVAAGRFSMLGQTVAVTAGAGPGPTTQFGGGYVQAGDVQAGDSVDVHGVLVQQGGSYVVQATRIDKLAPAPAYLRVSGMVSGLATGATPSFALAGLAVDATGATLLPAGTALANGQAVTLLALPTTLATTGAGAPRLQAAQIRVHALQGGGLDDYVSGSVSQLDAQAHTLMLGALKVNYSGASVTPMTTTLANGQYVQVRGTIAADGSLTAASIAIRDSETEDEAELHGNISGFDAATTRFTVRDVVVDASGASLQGCPATGLADGLYVQVAGKLGSSGVVAKTVQCESEPSGGTVEREGTASAVDLAAMRFTLTTQRGTVVTVAWTATTFFGGGTAQTMAGKPVEVQGTLVNGVLVATKVKIDD